MKLISLVALFAAPLIATAIRVSWDPVYDNGSQSLDTVACSNGPNGLEPKYKVFSDLPTFPNITGAYVVAGWNSPNCGSCWNITYSDTGVTVTVTVVDHAEDGFNFSEEAMNFLTNDQAEFLGAVDATAVQVDKSSCGL